MSTFKRASLDRAELLTPMSMSDALDAMTLDLKRLSRAGVSRSVVEASMASAVIHKAEPLSSQSQNTRH
ncbi:MAG: hypothetical protein V9E85_00100 [Candidatus Nanopelagicales bacterium]